MSRRARASLLLVKWESFARELHRGYHFDLDEWLNDVDARRLLAETGELLPSQRRRLATADDRVRAATQPHETCLWGSENARRHGWDAATHWYYFVLPHRHGEAFRLDLSRVR